MSGSTFVFAAVQFSDNGMPAFHEMTQTSCRRMAHLCLELAMLGFPQSEFQTSLDQDFLDLRSGQVRIKKFLIRGPDREILDPS